MKKVLLILMSSFILSSVYGGVSEDVYIEGKVSGTITLKAVHIKDAFGQTVIVKRDKLPRGLKVIQGQKVQFFIMPDDIIDIKSPKRKPASKKKKKLNKK